MIKNQKKSLVLQILKERNEKTLIKLLDNMTSVDIDDLYFLLTSADKKKIGKFVRGKESEIKKEFNELQRVESQAQRACLQFEVDKNK